MNLPTGAQAPALAKRLRERRKHLGLTLKDVAALSGLSFSFISQVERGRTLPSITSLVALSKALGASINMFLDQPKSDSIDTRRACAPGPSAARYERLSTRFPGSILNGSIITEPPGRKTEPMAHEGEELIYILDGSLTVEVAGQVYVLEEGDSLHFDSTRKHLTWNHTDQPARMLHACTMDYFNDDDERLR
ncbi:helix-turn-helix domain-containing protein [Ruixingdingia sedimenti]|uniref:XRE family transcriptional regulator n=1 Tax=Ruixingdingia sedimenti TaxID=3073604 RepID=A0ABU1FCB5_9RHOB|nr:XRE family transcriptional regulator [Xinfangfangia sp. LG-4]MDR5654208.1 XRE family transcriptional regulator [Xinfangfangia sp. LG-4]